MSQSFGELNRRLDGLRHDLGPGGDLERRTLAAFALAPEVARAVSADIGDHSMSGWRRGSPIQLAGKVTKLAGESFAIDPASRSAGPLRVLDSGRNGGGGFQGPGVNSVTGLTARTKRGAVRKVRANRRWNGRTEGKNTWGEAAAKIADRAGPVLNEQKTRALRKHFGF